MATIARTEQEVNDVLNAAIDQIDSGGTSWPGMSYEEGVRAGLDWVLGNSDENPMEE